MNDLINDARHELSVGLDHDQDTIGSLVRAIHARYKARFGRMLNDALIDAVNNWWDELPEAQRQRAIADEESLAFAIHERRRR